VNAGRRGIGLFAPILCASTLLHLAIIMVAANKDKHAARQHESLHMVVEYLESVNRQELPIKVLPPVRAQISQQLVTTLAIPAPAPSSGLMPLTGPPVRQSAAELSDLQAVTMKPTGISGLNMSGHLSALPSTAGSGTVTGDELSAGTGTGHSSGTAAAMNHPASLQQRSNYLAQLKKLIEAHKEYPLAARKSGREGSCQRRFVISRNGSLKGVETLSSCGHLFLDEAATRAIRAVGTFPPLPDDFKGDEETFAITMTFNLTRK